MGEFAVGALGLAPLVEQGQDRLDLLRSQPMHPRPARGPVGKPSTCSAADTAVRSPLLAATVGEDDGVTQTAAVREGRRPRPGVPDGALVVGLAV